jgi:hypothetical protein
VTVYDAYGAKKATYIATAEVIVRTFMGSSSKNDLARATNTRTSTVYGATVLPNEWLSADSCAASFSAANNIRMLRCSSHGHLGVQLRRWQAGSAGRLLVGRVVVRAGGRGSQADYLVTRRWPSHCSTSALSTGLQHFGTQHWTAAPQHRSTAALQACVICRRCPASRRCPSMRPLAARRDVPRCRSRTDPSTARLSGSER